MLALSILVAVVVQGSPGNKPWVEARVDALHPEAVVVCGSPELSFADALEAARTQARQDYRERMSTRAGQVAAEKAPQWLPAFAVERIADRWLRDQDAGRVLQVLDHDVVVREHGFGKSYQSFLLIAENEGTSRHALDQFSARLREGARRFVLECGGTALFWSLLALCHTWLDRLTRGYMTWRLRAVTVALAAVVPSLLFLL